MDRESMVERPEAEESATQQNTLAFESTTGLHVSSINRHVARLAVGKHATVLMLLTTGGSKASSTSIAAATLFGRPDSLFLHKSCTLGTDPSI